MLPDRLRVADARWTVEQLSNASQAVFEAGPALAGSGAQLVAVSASPTANSVIVLFSDITPEVSAYFGAHFPPGLIDLRVGGPVRANS